MEVVASTTRLGDWYANLVYRPGGQVILFVNERSLLPVLVAASPARSLVTRFQAAACSVDLDRGEAVPEQPCCVDEGGAVERRRSRARGAMHGRSYSMND